MSLPAEAQDVSFEPSRGEKRWCHNGRQEDRATPRQDCHQVETSFCDSYNESSKRAGLRSLHSVPGRLRIKTDLLCRTSTANAAQAGIASLGGVNTATINVVTGSLLITYDPMRLRADVVWTKLRELGVVSGTMPASDEGSVGPKAYRVR
jgi:hypothetical protein